MEPCRDGAELLPGSPLLLHIVLRASKQPFRGVAERKTRGLQVPVAIGRVGSNPAAPTKCMKKRIKASGVGCDAAACCFGRGR